MPFLTWNPSFYDSSAHQCWIIGLENKITDPEDEWQGMGLATSERSVLRGGAPLNSVDAVCFGTVFPWG